MTRGWRRHVVSLLAMGGFLALATATSKPRKDTADAGDAAPPSPPPSAQTAGPNDLEPLRVFATLGCDAKPANLGCSLLKEFEGGSSWVALPFPEEVWFGESTAIGGIADGKKELFFLQVSGSPAGFVGSARTLLPDNAREARDAAALLAATRLGNALPNSQAAAFMKTSAPVGGRRTLVKTSGKSQAFAQTPTQVFIRAKGERLLVVEHNGNFLSHDSPKGPGSALAWVAELFRVR
jgi:hypothetical protein